CQTAFTPSAAALVAGGSASDTRRNPESVVLGLARQLARRSPIGLYPLASRADAALRPPDGARLHPTQPRRNPDPADALKSRSPQNQQTGPPGGRQRPWSPRSAAATDQFLRHGVDDVDDGVLLTDDLDLVWLRLQ